MQKSFKKAIACLLAVLMVALSMPFSALAAPGDYKPDVQLQFSTFCADPSDPTAKDESQSADYSGSGLAAYPLQWDQTAGTLTASKADINSYNQFFDSEADAVDEDFVLSSGDLFAVTIRFDNVAEAASGNVNIRFSDNLTPAGFYEYKKGTKMMYGFASEANAPTTGSKYREIAGFRGTVPDWSASTLYKGMNDTVLGDLSCIQDDPNAVDGDGWSDLMMSATLVCEGDSVDVSSVSSENGFFDIVEGKLNGDPDDEIIGYTYDNQFIVATFVFELTDDTKPVQFALQDPTGEFDSELNNACFFAKKSEGLAKENATTYAPNGKNPGSMKMTFLGDNSNICKHTAAAAVVENEVAATCKAKGSYDSVVYCSKCGEELSRETIETDMIAHTPAAAVVENEVAATCTAKGSYDSVVKCSVCGTEISRETIETDKIAHTPAAAVVENEIPATCSAEGSYDEVVKCSVCQAELSRTPKTINKLAHTPGEAVQENRVEPTAEADGSYDEVIYCTECGEEISREPKTIPKHVHNYSAVVTNPTCTEQGYTTYTCTSCGDSYVSDYTDALNHDLTWTVTEAAVAPTCEEAGKTAVETATCSRCDYIDTRGGEEISALNHAWGDWTVTTEAVPATCEEAGMTAVETRVCANDASHVETKGGVVVPKLGHDLIHHEAQAATCTEAGWEAYDTCSRCDDYTTYSEIAALGHDITWTETTPEDPATCTETGTTAIETATCSRCEFTDTRGGEEIAALGHNLTWTETTPAEPATCTEKGKTAVETATCSRCEFTDTRGGEEVPAKGHTEVVVPAVAPTCTEKGKTEGKYCSVCGEIIVAQTEVPAKGHTEAVDAAVAPTCTAAGKTEGKHCSVCGAVIVAQTEVPATGHNWNEGVVTLEPTAMDKGVKTFTCQTCGETYNEEIDAYKATKANPIKVTAVKKTPTAKASTLKKKNVTFALKKFVKVTKSKGKVTYSKKSGNKKITIDSKTGKITLKKGLKKGTYKVKVKVQDHGNKTYKAKAKTVTFKIKVK